MIWLAAGAGITYGVLDALTKSTVDLLADRGAVALLRWEPCALLAAGILGTLLSQSAFHAGALSVSLPVIDTLEPISAVVIGAFVFGERLAASPASSPPNWPAGRWQRPASPPSAGHRWPRPRPGTALRHRANQCRHAGQAPPVRERGICRRSLEAARGSGPRMASASGALGDSASGADGAPMTGPRMNRVPQPDVSLPQPLHGGQVKRQAQRRCPSR